MSKTFARIPSVETLDEDASIVGLNPTSNPEQTVTWPQSVLLGPAVKRADLASPSTTPVGGYEASEFQGILDNALPLQSFTALSNYGGRASVVKITTPGIFGFFEYRSDLPNVTDYGYRIAHVSGVGAWERLGVTVLTPEMFGATHGSDDQVALERCFAAAKALSFSVQASGTYRHSSWLYVDSFALFGPATFIATDATPSNPKHSLILTGDSPEARDIYTDTTWAGARQLNDESSGIMVSDATGYSLTFCKTFRSASAGVFNRASDGGFISFNYNQDSLADGFHNTQGTKNLTLSFNSSLRSGDDSFAVVGYATYEQPQSIKVIGNRAVEAGARSFAFVGAKNVEVDANTSLRSVAAGLYVASESAYNTHPCINITGSGNVLEDSNTSSTILTGALCVSAESGYPVEGLVLYGTRIHYTGDVTCYASAVAATGGANLTGLNLDGLAIEGSPSIGAYFDCESPSVRNFNIAQSASHGIAFGPNVAGTMLLGDGTISGSGNSGAANQAHINVENASAAINYVFRNVDLFDGTYTVQPIRFIPARTKLASKNITVNGVDLYDSTGLVKSGSNYILQLPDAYSGRMEIQNLLLSPTEAIQIKYAGKKHCPVHIELEAVVNNDPNQWILLEDLAKYLISGPSGTAGVNYVALSGGVYSQREEIVAKYNGSTIALTMSVDGSDNVTYQIASAGANVAVRVLVRWAYRAA